MIFKEVQKEVRRGMTGVNSGLPMGLPALEGMVCKLQKECYYLVAGKTSAGKTAFVDQCFVQAPFNHFMSLPEETRDDEIKIDWLYYSLEISPTRKFVKLAAREMWERFNIETSVAELLSQGNHKLSDEKLEKLDQLEGYFKQFEKMMHIYDTYDTPLKIHNHLYRFYEKHGDFVITKGRNTYTPYHKNHYVIVVVDTINLLTPDNKQNLKAAIDSVWKDMIWYRNATPVICQQYNANISDPMRIQHKRLEPIADDLEDFHSLLALNVLYYYIYI